jgi:hypothetical protein
VWNWKNAYSDLNIIAAFYLYTIKCSSNQFKSKNSPVMESISIWPHFFVLFNDPLSDAEVI